MKLLQILFLLLPISLCAQQGNLSGTVLNSQNNKGIADAIVSIENPSRTTFTDLNGNFVFKDLPYGTYKLVISLIGNVERKIEYEFSPQSKLEISLETKAITLDQVNVKAQETSNRTTLRAIEGTSIFESKKSEVIKLKNIEANLATNNPRQVYAKVTGLAIWESDGAGLQLGIGARGLSPNRTANFNTRQNGYDISADALGYPESYYTPPAEALNKIEIIRGAASLQYGTQFGGMLNFVFNEAPKDKKISLTSRQTLGSWNFKSTFNQVAGTLGKFSYSTFYQKKKGDGWRENSGFDQNTFFVNMGFSPIKKLKIGLEYTHSDYEAQQAGGLTDLYFEQDPRKSYRDRNWFAVNWNLAALTLDWKLNKKTKLTSKTFVLSANRNSVGNLERITLADLGGNRTLIQGDFNNIGNETRLLSRYALGNQYGALVVGTRIYKGNTTAKQGDADSGSGPSFSFLNESDLEDSDYNFNNTNLALFAENLFHISEKFTVTPGIRLEYIKTQSIGFYKQRVLDFAGNIVSETTINENNSKPRHFIIAGIGASYRPNEKTEVYGNISQNYRAINFSDLRVNNPNYRVDPDIYDEKGFTSDLGIRGTKGTYFTYDLSLFHIFYKGRIGQKLVADQPPLYTDYRLRTNIADARNIGLEFFGELDLLKLKTANTKNALAIFINTALVDAKYINTEESSIINKKVEMVPPFMIRTGLTASFGKFGGTATFAHTQEHFTDATNAIRTATAVEGIVPSYQVVDLSASFTHKIYKAEFSINNALNASYFSQRAEAYPGPGIIPADGRGFFLTLGINL